MVLIVNFVAIFLLMLVTGVFWGPWFALSRSLKVFNVDEFIHIAKIMSANLGMPMRFLLPGCILLMVLAVGLYPQKTSMGFYSGIAAVILIVSSLIITVAIEVPIVKNIEQWSAADHPANWATIRDRWVKFHIFRTVASLASFACFILSVLILTIR